MCSANVSVHARHCTHQTQIENKFCGTWGITRRVRIKQLCKQLFSNQKMIWYTPRYDRFQGAKPRSVSSLILMQTRPWRKENYSSRHLLDGSFFNFIPYYKWISSIHRTNKKFKQFQGFTCWGRMVEKHELCWQLMSPGPTSGRIKNRFADAKLTTHGMPEVTSRDGLPLGEEYSIRPRACWVVVMVGTNCIFRWQHSFMFLIRQLKIARIIFQFDSIS